MSASAGGRTGSRGRAALSSSVKPQQLALTATAAADDDESNPFRLPATLDVFAVREEERKREFEVRRGARGCVRDRSERGVRRPGSRRSTRRRS